VWTFSHVCPLRDSGSAALIGGLWLLMTVAFEFLFGRYVAKQDWKRLLADYDLRRGRVWPLFLAWITILPWLVYRFWRSRIIAATERTLAGPPVVMCGHGNYSRNCLPARHNAL
jgi:hypothetical protein